MWIYWSTRELQDEIGEDHLDFLEKVIPELSSSGNSSNFIGNRSKLAMLVESLQDHDYFRKRANLEKCLFKIPREKLVELCRGINFTGDKKDLQAVAKKILINNTNYEKFTDIFGLDQRFLSTATVNLDAFFDNHAASAESPKLVTKP